MCLHTYAKILKYTHMQVNYLARLLQLGELCYRVYKPDALTKQPLTHLSAHGGDLRLVHARLSHHVSQRASGQILHHHPQLVTNQVTAATRQHQGNTLHYTE